MYIYFHGSLLVWRFSLFGNGAQWLWVRSASGKQFKGAGNTLIGTVGKGTYVDGFELCIRLYEPIFMCLLPFNVCLESDIKCYIHRAVQPWYLHGPVPYFSCGLKNHQESVNTVLWSLISQEPEKALGEGPRVIWKPEIIEWKCKVKVLPSPSPSSRA